MKFSHSLQFNSVPDWADKYIAYSNLKKSIYTLEQNQTLDDLPIGASSNRADDIENEAAALLENSNNEADKIFVTLLNQEVRRISEFFVVKEQQLDAELVRLQSDLEAAEREDVNDVESDDGSDDDDDDVAGDYRNADTTASTLQPRARKASLRNLFGNPRMYNEASQEERQMRGFAAPSGGDGSYFDSNANASAANGSAENQSEQTTLNAPSAPRKRALSTTSQNGKQWPAFFKRRPSKRRSLGLMGGDVLDASRSDGGDSSAFASGAMRSGDGLSMSIWTAENDYAVDLRITYKRRITDLFVAFSELKQFVQLNETGIKKILKKYDKTLGSSLKDSYLDGLVRKQYPFRGETVAGLEEHIQTLTQYYAKVVTSGDVALAFSQLKGHLREQVVWQRNTVWREMIGIERRAQGASLQQSVMGGRSQDGEKPRPTKVCGFVLPPWLGIPTVQLAVAITLLVLLLKAPPLRFFPRVEEQNCLALLVFCTVLWATEVIPLFVTSLMVPFLVVTLRVGRTDDIEDRRLNAAETTKWIFSTMFTPSMCLLLGGFTIAAALSKYGIDKLLAQRVLRLAGTRPSFVLLAHMCVACFASMWISNVAAPVLLYSLIQPILRNLPPKSSFGPSMIMGIALASNIGGQTSPIASPQNLIALQYMPDGLGWLQWFAITIPVSGLSLVIIWILLLWTYGSGRGTVIKRIPESSDRFSGIQYFISTVTIGTIVLWCLERNFEHIVGDMGVIAILPMLLLFGTGILNKEDFNNFLWTVVVLAMGGIALGKAVTSSGLLASLDDVIQSFVAGMPIWKVWASLLCISLVVATFISHTIAAVLLVPIAQQVGESLQPESHPKLLIMATVLTASAACGLPVSGFPNMTAVSQVDSVGHRYVTAKDFLRVGVPASIAATAVVATVGYVIMSLLGL
ncbi:unnamed protein product [Parajaminaea phylloscopi]